MKLHSLEKDEGSAVVRRICSLPFCEQLRPQESRSIPGLQWQDTPADTPSWTTAACRRVLQDLDASAATVWDVVAANNRVLRVVSLRHAESGYITWTTVLLLTLCLVWVEAGCKAVMFVFTIMQVFCQRAIMQLSTV